MPPINELIAREDENAGHSVYLPRVAFNRRQKRPSIRAAFDVTVTIYGLQATLYKKRRFV